MARDKSSSAISINEIDSIYGARGEGEYETMRRVKIAILVQMQLVGLDNKNVLMLRATNLPWEIDQAIRRSFEKRIKFHYQTRETHNNLNGNDFEESTKETDGSSGSDLATLTKDAIMAPLKKC
ncbi:unnamed protein product [Moneuplotes crassus]|uniref:ATPase AAA-type core domain-containing protein n=1 Tax=Euplotes crassus TaxID=5936 RepID=A0AAD1UGC3_EUPCR|nr:unnamed protein product [Moneuplotes crassus]